MKPASWVWSGTDASLRGLHALLATVGVMMLAAMAWVLLHRGSVTLPAERVERVALCRLPAYKGHLERAHLAQALLRHAEATPDCWRDAALPISFSAAPDTPPGDIGTLLFRAEYRVPPGWPPADALAIYAPRPTGAAWRLWIDGVAIADNLDDWRQTANRGIAVRVPLERMQAGRRLRVDLALSYAADAYFSLPMLRVGPFSALEAPMERRDFLQSTAPMVCSVALLLIGAVFFAFWLLRRRETAHLLLTLASVAWTLCNLQYFAPRLDNEQIDGLYIGIIAASVPWFMWFIYLFALRFDVRRNRWLELALPIYALVMTMAALPPFGLVRGDDTLAFQAVNAIVASAVTGLIAKRAFFGGGTELRLIALGLVIALAAGAHDVAMLGHILDAEGVYVFPLAGPLVFASFLFAMQRRYAQAIDAQEALSASLAQKLAEREAELERNYQKLRGIERAQMLSGERQRLMRDMHDGLGAALTSSLAALERGKLDCRSTEQMLRDCVDELRMVIDSLEPMDDDVVAVLAALRFRIGARLEAAGLKLDWQMGEVPRLTWMGPSEALQLMRIVQGALANVLQHACARHVMIAAAPIDCGLEISISDDGIGFDPLTIAGGRGLRFISQRARRLGGTLRLESSPGQGTSIHLQLHTRAPSERRMRPRDSA